MCCVEEERGFWIKKKKRGSPNESEPQGELVGASHRRVGARDRPVEDNIRYEARQHRLIDGGSSSKFSAKYIPFNTGQYSVESYSLNEIINRSNFGGLLDIQHDMDTLKMYDVAY